MRLTRQATIPGNAGGKIMRALGYAALTVGLLLALASQALANEWILGDSLGVGVTLAAKQKLSANQRRAQKQIAQGDLRIRDTAKIIDQIKKVPAGETALMVLGTNDAKAAEKGVEALNGIEVNIQQIVRAADVQRIKLTWIGPPCVKQPWDTAVVKLDEILTAQLKSTSVNYVSTHGDTELCKSLETDGVHLKMTGYMRMRNIGRMTAGLPVDPSFAVAQNNAPGSVEPIKPAETAQTPAGSPQAQPGTQAGNTTPPAETPKPPQDAPANIPPPEKTAKPPVTPPPVTVAEQPPPPKTLGGGTREPRVRIVVTPGIQRIGPIRLALGLGPDPYLEAPFPLRRR